MTHQPILSTMSPLHHFDVARAQNVAWGLSCLTAATLGILFLAGMDQVWRMSALLLTAAVMFVLAMIMRAAPSTKAAFAERVHMACFSLAGGNALLALAVANEPNAGFWLAPLIVAAGLGHRSRFWFVGTASILVGGWLVVGLIADVSADWLTPGPTIVVSVLLGALLQHDRESELVGLAEAWHRDHYHMHELEQRLEEFRTALSERINSTEELKKQIREVKHLASVDGLTGLYNQRRINWFLRSKWAAIQHAYRSVAVIYLDLKAFHAFNAKYGYLAGNTVLCRVAEVIRPYAQNELQLATRVEGNRFMLILSGVGRFRAAEIVSEIQARVARITLPDFGVRRAGEIQICIGSASCRVTAKLEPMDVIGAADAALADAKTSKRSNVVRLSTPGSTKRLGDVGEVLKNIG